MPIDSFTAELLSNTVLYFGGPAVVIAVMSCLSAYNQWKTRKAVEDIRKKLFNGDV